MKNIYLKKEVRAYYTEDFIRVYQAYGDNIVQDIEKKNLLSAKLFI